MAIGRPEGSLPSRLQFLFLGVAYSMSVPPSFPHDKVQNLIAKNENECPSAQIHCDEGSFSTRTNGAMFRQLLDQ
jgi:hypothetical protein